jgi:Ca-activated chloride channel family protein
VLARAPAMGSSSTFGFVLGNNASSFSGPGAHGTLSLSQTKVLAGSGQTLFAELRLKADESRTVAEARAPLSLAIVMDTSGSMSGEKLEHAKRSVTSLLRQMRDDDEVALVRYDSNPELIQPLARVGSVVSSLIDRVSQLSAGGGTNIPPALSQGLSSLSHARSGRVRRVVLVSDGLDGGRQESERIARSALDSQVTVSALGIGLDFDEGYMSGVASSGRGNFGFVQDASTLARFLQRELEETAKTVVENARAKLELPPGARFIRAVGAETDVRGGEVELLLGALFAGDERRVVIEIETDAEPGQTLPFRADVSWQRLGGDRIHARLSELSVVGDSDPQLVAESRDGRVYASALSATASQRQIAAAEAYARGDVAAADQLIQKNLSDLEVAAAAAPAEERESLRKQRAEAADVQSKFRSFAPGSEPAKAAGKASAFKNSENLSRKSSF